MAARVTVSCVTRLLSSWGASNWAFLVCFSGILAFLASFLVALDLIGFNWLTVVGAQGFWAMGLSLESVSWGLTLTEQTLLLAPSGAALSLSSSSEHPHSFGFWLSGACFSVFRFCLLSPLHCGKVE